MEDVSKQGCPLLFYHNNSGQNVPVITEAAAKQPFTYLNTDRLV